MHLSIAIGLQKFNSLAYHKVSFGQ